MTMDAPAGWTNDGRALVRVFDRKNFDGSIAFVNAVARKNVELTMAQLLEKSPVLRELQSKRVIQVAGAMYDLETAKVEFFA